MFGENTKLDQCQSLAQLARHDLARGLIWQNLIQISSYHHYICLKTKSQYKYSKYVFIKRAVVELDGQGYDRALILSPKYEK